MQRRLCSTRTLNKIVSQKTKQDALEFLWIWEQLELFCLFKIPYKSYSDFAQRTITNIRIFPLTLSSVSTLDAEIENRKSVFQNMCKIYVPLILTVSCVLFEKKWSEPLKERKTINENFENSAPGNGWMKPRWKRYSFSHKLRHFKQKTTMFNYLAVKIYN